MMDSLIYIITGIIFFIIFSVVAIAEEMSRYNNKKNNVLNENKKIKEQDYLNRAMSTLEESGFCIEKKITLNKVTEYLTMNDVYAVLFDNKQKKFALIDCTAEMCCVMDYKSFISCEIFCNKTTELAGTDGMALLGGIMLGTTGAIVGASAPKELSNKLNDLKLFIKLNDFKIDHVSFQILSAENGALITKNEETDIFDKVNEVVAAFEYIKNNVQN